MKKLKYIFFIIVIILVIAQPFVAYSQTPVSTPTGTNIKIPNPLKCSAGQDCSTLLGLINMILTNIIMPIATVACVGYIIWAGFKYVSAQGKPEKIKEANQNLLWALIGVGVLLGAAGISGVLRDTINSIIGTQ